jgi:CRISPR-associated exonuclease Cas4
MVPLSALNHYLFCARRAALIHGEGIFEANEHTLRGDIVHEHTDLRGYEVVQGVKLLRALPVFSGRLGLNGKCDIVEQRRDGTLFPVEFKLGKRRQWENDDAQLCAQALCLEEMFGVSVPCGAIFHADSKRRREVNFTPGLRQATEQATAALHALLGRGDDEPLPQAVLKRACEECSLYDICLPALTSRPSALTRMKRALYET